MDSLGYFYLWFLAQVVAIVCGFASHYASAHLSLPQKLFDGFRWRDHALNEALNDNYVWWADYDDQGFWEFHSVKNLLLHIVPTSLAIFVLALAYYPERSMILSQVCSTAANVGLQPLFCP